MEEADGRKEGRFAGWQPSAKAGFSCFPHEVCESTMEVILQYFKDILNILNDGIYITDCEGTTLLVNTMYEQLTGLSQEVLKGRNVNTLVEEGIFDRILNPEIVSSKHPAVSVQTIHGDKQVILHGYPVLDAAGDVRLVVTFARDITMISQFREQIAKQKLLIEEFSQRLEGIIKANATAPPAIFQSEVMVALMSRLSRVAKTDATILLLGETGVGKDVLARLAHEHSGRSKGIFLKIDCGSIAPNLIESELFGYAPGAFSGASTKGKAGYFEMADKGTIFLDEIGDLPLAMQTRLLRVLQDGEVTPGWERPNRAPWTSASSPPPTMIWLKTWKAANSGAICSTA